MTEHDSPDELRERWKNIGVEGANQIFEDAIAAYEAAVSMKQHYQDYAAHYQEKASEYLVENRRLYDALREAAAHLIAHGYDAPDSCGCALDALAALEANND